MLVSVIIPCYNVENYIEECINSVLKQTYNTIEIICIDNNSTDTTAAVLFKLKAHCPLLIVDKEEMPGANAARNKGLSLAKGNWIQFLDADDLLMPEKINHQLGLLSNLNNCAFIAGASIKKTIDQKEIYVTELESDPFIAPFINKAGNTCANLWNRAWLQKVNGWNNTVKSSQETDLMLRLVAAGGNLLPDPEALTIIRERESGQISQRNPAQKWKQFIDVRLSYLSTLHKIKPEQYQAHAPLFFDFLMVSIGTLARYDKEAAIDYYRQHIRKQWKSAHAYGYSLIKVFMIKTLGIRTALSIITRS